jgi:hypothetical protein
MNAINWIRFTWDLAALPESESKLAEHYQITPAAKDDEKELRKVIGSSFTLDPSWNPAMQEAMQTIDGWLDASSDSDGSVHLVLRHGLRIIGASVVSLDPTAENHLAPGPCLLMEYRNRGFGTRLLERSLGTLRAAGLTHACAIAKENSPVTDFLYKKFNSTVSPFELTRPLAA